MIGRKYHILLSFVFLLAPYALPGQVARTVLNANPDTVRIDTLSLVPGSWKVMTKAGGAVPDSLYRVDWVSGVLIWQGKERPAADSVIVEYSHYPVALNKVYQNKDLNYNRIDRPLYRPPALGPDNSLAAGFGDASLKSAGSLSRGISAGNQRDVSLSSNLNLQVEGKLSRDFMIEATLTDANIPVQPEGNTQQIQDFDRVYMRIYNPKNEILGGDFDLIASESYFLKMNKKVQGARYTAISGQADGRRRFITSSGAAVVKGKYTRNQIRGLEGNQGPYALTGSNGETYLQVIAGSEKVYIDGVLMMRGEDADYVMDYNTAEIRFTPRRLITKDKRIQVEFEYTERSYARFLLYNETQWSGPKGSWYLNVFSENDAKNQPLVQDLSDAGRDLLYQVGDQSDLASISAIRESGFRNDRVFYKMIDTLVNGIRYDSVLLQSISPDSARYEAGFSFMGAGKGNYEPASSAANGRVFRWVAPENGIPKGSYDPVTRLTTPKSKQVITAGTRQQLGRRMEFETEWALTRNDLNTFSPADDADNTGLGVRSALKRMDYLRADSSLRLQSFVNHRFTGARFDPVERYREIEFDRDWNLGNVNGYTSEHLLVSGLRLAGNDSLQAGYRFEYLGRGIEYSGFRQFTDGRLGGKKWEAGWNGSYLVSADPLRETRFLRHNARFLRRFGQVDIEVGENAEDNRWLNAGNDSLLNISAAFRELRLQAGQSKGDQKPWLVRVQHRTDLVPVENSMQPAARAWEAESWINLSKNPANPFRAGFHFRSLEADSGRLAAGETGRSVTGRIDNRWQAWKGLLQSQTFFEIGSGYDRKPEYTYLEVAAGQGYYTWNDYNTNNIKELDEFEPAYFKDQAAYIRIFRLGNLFIPTLVNRFNQVITIQPKKGFISKFYSQLAYRIDKKNLREDYLNFLNPFSGNASDERLISLNSQLRHTLSFNRTNPKFNADLVTQKQASRNTLINGAEGKTTWSNALLIRYRFHPAWQLNSNTEYAQKKSVSEYFPARNFVFNSWSELLQAEFQAASSIRFGLDWELRSEKSPGISSGNLLSNRMETSVTGQIPDKGQISLSLQHLFIRFDGKAESPSGYALLRGFRPGHNGIAQLSVRYKLGKNLIMEVLYEGRIATGSRIVHNAQVQVRAIF